MRRCPNRNTCSLCDRVIEPFTGNNCLESYKALWIGTNSEREREKNPPENPLTERLELYERNEIILPNINFGNGGDDKQQQLYQIKSALPPALPNVFIFFFFIFIIAKFPWYAWHCLHIQTQSWHRASFSVKKRKVERNWMN